ncbi:hypothetical protein [Actinoplanes sp. URMC 104]|uniref:hypothetical protein n=1 Tax=Actinoplanes sp. URMC 104 TaxID=3423409 RepID=UPI003F1B78FC
MPETETHSVETPETSVESPKTVSETLAAIAETLTETDRAAETVETRAASRPVSGLRSPVSETETRRPAPRRTIRKVVVHKHTGIRRPARPLFSRTPKTADVKKQENGEQVMPLSVRLLGGFGLTILSGLVAVMASVGQVLFAKAQGAVEMLWLLGHDITPYFAPALFDLSVAVLLARGLRAAYKNRSPWPYWIAGFGVGGYSMFTNTQHEGALLFAGASGILMLIWFLNLYGDYVDLEIAAERRAAARPKLILSDLMLSAPRTAIRAQIIVSRKDLPRRVAELAAEGKPTSERALAIKMADLWLTLFDDRLMAELAVAGRKNGARKQARRKAKLTAWREVDRRLGEELVDLTGIEIGEVTYAAPKPQPAPVVVEPQPQAEKPKERPANAPVSPAAGKSELPMDGLPVITDPALRAEADKDLKYLVRIITHPDFDKGRWHSRKDDFSKADIETATGIVGSGTQYRLMVLVNKLRDLPLHDKTAAA